jgi:molecular chaperone IbpA
MRTALDFSPLHRSTVGFDRLFDLLDRASRLDVAASWPPYDIERVDENAYRIRMAVAGFGPDEVEVVQNANSLIVTGHKPGEGGTRQMLHQGIAFRNFKQSFGLADYVSVASASLADGILTIDLRREIPEALKPRRIAISDGAAVERIVGPVSTGRDEAASKIAA